MLTLTTMEVGALISNLVLLGLLLTSSYTDFWYRKIYNKVTIPSLLAGLLLAAATNFPAGLWNSLSACLLAFIIFFLMFLCGYMGGGDVKLVAAIGALVGFPMIVDAIFFSIIFGGVYAITILLFKGRLWQNLKNVFFFIWNLLLWRQVSRLDAKNSTQIPYGFCLALGTGIALITKHFYQPAGVTFVLGF